MDVAVIRRVESQIAGAGGRTLFRRAWLPPAPERVLLLVHGFAEHSGRYEHVGAWFAQRGCAVHAYDQRGHGRSEGVRGHVGRFDEFLDDIEVLLGQVRQEHAGLPIFVVGHSMGGLAVAAFGRERLPDVTGLVISAAALAIQEVPSSGRLLLMRVMRRLSPKLQLDQTIDPDTLSRDPEVCRAYVEDPLVFQKMTLSLAAELFDRANATLPGGAEVRVPVLVLHGSEDRLCPASGSEAFHGALEAPGSDLRIYPGLRHEIFNEPEQESVFADVLEWLCKREVA